jgi:hypothetical protein
MGRWIGRWGERVGLALVVACLAVYGGDSALFRLRGRPQCTVTVTRYIAVPLKGNKTEYDDQGTLEVACAKALLPQAGLSPCWWLRRHPEQRTDL